MKKKTFDSKVNLAIVISLFFIMVLGCQPEKGKLVALPSEGLEITASDNKNDVVTIKSDDLLVSVSGTWGDGILFEITVKNSGSKDLIVDFGEMKLVNGEDESATVGGIIETLKGGFNTIREARVNNKQNTEKAPQTRISPKENRQFSVVFSQPFNTAKDDEKKRTLYLTIPVITDGKPETKRELKVGFEATKWETGH